MGGEQAATVLATITKDQRAREGKEVMSRINHPICTALGRLELAFAGLLPNHTHYERPLSFSGGLLWHLYEDKIISMSGVKAMAEHCSHQMSVIKMCQAGC